MRKFNFKLWEKFLILFSVLLFVTSLGLYVTDFPLRKYIFGLSEEDGQIVVGTLKDKAGTLKRQLLGETSFKNIEAGTTLYNMDVLVTGPDSDAVLQFENGDSIKMGPSTMIRLAFQSSLALDGISRSGRLDVVSGKVTGQTVKKKIVIASKEGITEIKPDTKQTIEIKDIPIRPKVVPPPVIAKAEVPLTAPTPPPLPLPVALPSLVPLPMPSLMAVAPSPSPIPPEKRGFTPEEAELVKILAPRNGERLAITELTKVAEKPVRLVWKMTPPEGQAQLTLWRLAKAGGSKVERKEIFHKIYSAHRGQGIVLWKALKPGNYEWQITSPEGKPLSIDKNTRARFYVEPEFEGIRNIAALVGGKSTTTNKLTGEIVNNFDITLRWDEYPQADSYKIKFFSSPNSKKPIMEKVSKKAEYKFNKDKIFTGQLYYQVVTPLESGFVVTSNVQKFSFSFLPPALVVPENNVQLSKGTLVKEGNRLLFTWQKTNFTLGYELEIAKDPNFKDIYVKRTLKENYYILPNPPAGQHWWRVRSFSKETSSPMSPPNSFTVAP
jgi:hypothetical protein